MKTKIINLRKEHYDVYIGRGSVFGNPFIIGKDGDRNAVIKKFEIYFYKKLVTDEGFKARVLKLYSKRLGCYCKPLKCHGDIIVEYLEKNG